MVRQPTLENVIPILDSKLVLGLRAECLGHAAVTEYQSGQLCQRNDSSNSYHHVRCCADVTT